MATSRGGFFLGPPLISPEQTLEYGELAKVEGDFNYNCQIRSIVFDKEIQPPCGSLTGLEVVFKPIGEVDGVAGFFLQELGNAEEGFMIHHQAGLWGQDRRIGCGYKGLPFLDGGKGPIWEWNTWLKYKVVFEPEVTTCSLIEEPSGKVLWSDSMPSVINFQPEKLIFYQYVVLPWNGDWNNKALVESIRIFSGID